MLNVLGESKSLANTAKLNTWAYKRQQPGICIPGLHNWDKSLKLPGSYGIHKTPGWQKSTAHYHKMSSKAALYKNRVVQASCIWGLLGLQLAPGAIPTCNKTPYFHVSSSPFHLIPFSQPQNVTYDCGLWAVCHTCLLVGILPAAS